MKKTKWLLLILIAGLVFGAYRLFVAQTFNAEKILAQSILKERTFSGKAEEISLFDGKSRAYYMAEHHVPLVSISFGFNHAGRAYETPDGVGLMAENVLLDGAGDYSRQELRDLMKEKGIKLAVSAGNDTLNFSLSYVKKFEKEALEVLKAVLYQPKLDEKDLDLTRRQLAIARQKQNENPRYHLGRLVDKEFYGEHPYGKENIPEDEALAQISAETIRQYLAKVMGKDNIYIGVAGDISKELAQQFLEDAFEKLADKAEISDLPEFSPDYSADVVQTEVPFSAQSFVLTSAKGVKRLDKDFYPLYIADYVLGGSGFNSRLYKAVREKEGLTYGIYSYFSNSDAVDGWHVSFSATGDKVDQALEIAQNEYLRFYEQGISKEELEQAKKSMLSSFNLRFSSLFNIADMLKEMQRQKLGIDFLQKRQKYVAQVTLEQVNDAIRRRMPKSLDKNGLVRVFRAEAGKK
ncbi:MAG: insulinase family protein [Alphaproteobacteria bacterium]|nr:insulinase family protein [Alphaproteobacteria bacterium]